MLNGTGFFKRSVLLILLAITPATAQDLRRLTRSTSVAGLNDSALTLTSDSARRTRAASIAQFRKALSVKAFDSLVATGASRFPGGITVSACTGCAPLVADSATGAVRAQKLTTARTIGGVSFDGTANITPALSDSATGSARSQTLTTARTLWGQSFNGSANISGSLTSVTDVIATARGKFGDTLATSGTFAGIKNAGGFRIAGLTTSGGTGGVLALMDGGVNNLLTLSANSDSTLRMGGLASNRLQLHMGTGSLKLADSLLIGNASVGGTGAARIMGGSGSMSVQSGTGNSRRLTFQTTTSAGTVTDAVRLNEQQQTLTTTGTQQSPGIAGISDTTTGFRISSAAINASVSGTTRVTFNVNQNIFGQSGSAAAPSVAIGTGNVGMYILGSQDSLAFATNGVRAIGIMGGATPTIFGGAGNMTIQAGTGNSRRLALQTTGGGGVAVTALRFNELQQSLFADGNGVTPSVTFGSDTTTGIYRSGAGQISFTFGSTQDVIFDNTKNQFFRLLTAPDGSTAAPSYSFNNGTSTGLALGNNGATDTLNLVANAAVIARGTGSGFAALATNTNDNAAAGWQGEYMSHQTVTGSSVSLSTNTTANIDSLTLTAGDWDVYGVVDFTFGATTSYTNIAGGVSSTSATLATDQGFDFETPATVPTATKDEAWTVSPVRFSVSGSTKVYLVAQGTFTVSTLKAYGSIRARRAR